MTISCIQFNLNDLIVFECNYCCKRNHVKMYDAEIYTFIQS